MTILVILLLLGAMYFGGCLFLGIYYAMYKLDKQAFSIITEFDADLKKWIDEGNKLKTYPKERVKEFKLKWKNRKHDK